MKRAKARASEVAKRFAMLSVVMRSRNEARGVCVSTAASPHISQDALSQSGRETTHIIIFEHTIDNLILHEKSRDQLRPRYNMQKISYCISFAGVMHN
jgi:hypothetical protein